jgi:hypothetical protein
MTHSPSTSAWLPQSKVQNPQCPAPHLRGRAHRLRCAARPHTLRAEASPRRLGGRRDLRGEGAELLEHLIAHFLGRGRGTHRGPARLDREHAASGRLERLLRPGGDSGRGLGVPGEDGGGPAHRRRSERAPRALGARPVRAASCAGPRYSVARALRRPRGAGSRARGGACRARACAVRPGEHVFRSGEHHAPRPLVTSKCEYLFKTTGFACAHNVFVTRL